MSSKFSEFFAEFSKRWEAGERAVAVAALCERYSGCFEGTGPWEGDVILGDEFFKWAFEYCGEIIEWQMKESRGDNQGIDLCACMVPEEWEYPQDFQPVG